MADTTINFNPAKFAGGVLKTFASATSQTISSYIPFTSEVLSDASDTAFNIKQYIAENRPDRNSRNESGVLRMMANKTLNASRTFLSDLSHGDLSFSRSRENMIGYLKKNSQSEFDFDFDFDFDDESNESMPEEKSFTADDYVQGVYESTMATMGAIEASTNKLAYMNAKSNSILGDRLISNNMASMAQTMQMLNTVNENISGVNTNLASLVEYNNTTMNDFIKNTTTHFAKVESFMDMITKRYETEDKGSSSENNPRASSNDMKIFTGSGINLGNLLKKTIVSADSSFGTMGTIGSITKLLASGIFGADNLPKFLKDLEGPDLSTFVEMINPAKMITDLLLPDLSKLTNIDSTLKGFASVLKRKLTTDRSNGGFFDGSTKLGEFLIKLFTDEDDRLYKTAKNEKASWMSSDSDVLQHVIPSFISETNVSLNYLNSNVSAIYRLFEYTTKEITSFHEDSLRAYRFMLESGKDISNAVRESGTRRGRGSAGGDESGGANKQIDKNIKTLTSKEGHVRKHRRRDISNIAQEYRTTERAVADKYRDEHKLIYDARTMSLRTYGEILKEDRNQKLAAYKTGANDISDAFYRLVTKNGDIENIDETYGIQGLSESISNRLNQIIGVEAMIKENPRYVSNGRLNETNIIADVMDYFESLGIFDESTLSGTNKAKLVSTIRSVSESRFNAIDKYRENYMKDVVLHQVKRSEEGSEYRIYSGLDGRDLQDLMDDPKYKDAFKIVMLKSDTDLFKMAANAQLLDAVQNGLSKDSDEYRRLKEDSDRRYNAMVRSMDEKKKNPLWKLLIAQNPVNMYASALIDTINEYLATSFSTLLHTDDGNLIEQMRDAITSKPITDAFTTFADKYANRQGTFTTFFDGERHRGQRVYSASRWGEYQEIDSEGRDLGWFPDPEYESIKETNINAGYSENENHKWVRQRDDGTYEAAPRQYVQPTLMSFATGATRIDHDQIAQVHEGEMILDKALSEGVRTNIVNMVKAGGLSKLSDDQYKELVKSISESDERFKGHEEEIIKDITRVIDAYDIKDESKIELSKESICFIDVDENESFASLFAKKVSEIAINLGIVTRSILNKDAEEIAEENKDKAKKGGNFLLGSKNEQGMYTGGFISDKINKIKDDFNYWRFKNIDGKGYTGFTRDEAGNVTEGAGLKTYNAEEENPETIFKMLKDYARSNASKFADKQGWTGDKKEEYLKSIDKLVDGVPGALKGGVGGLALSAVLGGFAPAIGMLGGFALSNKETREFVFGKTVTDSEGHKHVEGGIFGGFTNKLIEAGDTIKYNFTSTFKDVAVNLKLGFKHFVDRLTNSENSSITEGIATFIDQVAGGKKGAFATKLLGGIMNTTKRVADGATDIAIDAVTVGSKLMFKAASLPFNAFASIIGGKGYRDDKRAEKKAARTEQMRKIFNELVQNDAMLGIDPTKHIITKWQDHRDRLARENEMYTRTGNLQGRHLFGKGGKIYDTISLHRQSDNTQNDNAPKAKTVFDKMSEGIDKLNDSVTGDFAKNALRGVVGAVLAGPLAMTGHPILAASMLGAGMSSAIAKQIFGTGILHLFSSGIKLVGKAITQRFKRVGEFIGNRVHAVKEALGIHDNKFYLNRMMKGSHIDKGSILTNLGFSNEDSAEYFELANKDPNDLTQDEKIKLQGYENAVADGYLKNDASYRQMIVDDKEYEKLRKNKNRTEEEDARFKELQQGIADRRWGKFKHKTLDQLSYRIDYGWSKNKRLKALSNTTLDDFNNAQASIKFNSELSTKITPEMFAAMGITDPARQQEMQKDMDARLKKLRERVISKYGSLDAAKDYSDDLKNMILSSNLGKNKAAVKDKSANEFIAFLRDGNIARANQEEQMRDNITTIKDKVENAVDFIEKIYTGLKNKLFEPKVESGNLYHSSESNGTSENSSELSVNEIQNMSEEDRQQAIQDTTNQNTQSITDMAADAVNFISDPLGTISDGLYTLDGEDDNARQAAVADSSQARGSHLSGAFNIPSTGLYQLHAGEMVFDPETADKVRQNFAGAFGRVGNATTDVFEKIDNKLGIIKDNIVSVTTNTANKIIDGKSDEIRDTFKSMKKDLSGILTVFTGDTTGSEEAKKSFLDKMKDSFTNVGNLISNTVRGSGLIPIGKNGKPDIALIGTRLISLIGGAILFGPAIKRVMETLAPVVQPIFDTLKTGITSAISGLTEFISPIASDILSGLGGSIRTLLGLKEGDSVIAEVAHSIAQAWEGVWESAGAAFYHDLSTKGQIDDATTKDTTSVGAINDFDSYKSEYTKYVNTNSKYKGYSDEAKQRVVLNLASDRKQFLIACGEYWSTLLGFLSRHIEMFNGTTDAKEIAIALTTNSSAYAINKSKMFQNLTSAEKTFCNKAIKYPSILTNFTALYNNEELKTNFLDVIKSTSGISVKLADNLDIKVDDKYEYQDFTTAIDKVQERIDKLKSDDNLINDTTGKAKNTPASSPKYSISGAYNYIANKWNEQWSDFNQTPSDTNNEITVSNYDEWMNSPYVDELYAGSGIGYGYTQNDPRWSRQRYGNFKSGNASTLGSGGCGPTALANVYSNLTGKSINPAQMARFSQSNGYNAQGGTSAGLFTSGARKLGLSSNAISKSSSSIKNSIKSGKNVIIAGKNGPYTKSGHIMSVRGVDSRGNAIVDDPLKKGSRRISMKKLTRGMTHAWSIGYGEETGPGGQQYSIWNDKFLDGEVTFNRNGGAFGYYGPNVGGPDYMDGACIYNSFINGYINALLGKTGSISDFVKRVNWTPSTLYSSGMVTNYNGSSGVTSYSGLAAELEKATGMKINFIDLSDPTAEQLPDLYNTLYTNLNSGNPILFSSNSGTSAKMRDIISSNAEHAAAGTHSNNPQHGVLLAGLYKDKDGNEFVVIDNPNTGRATSDGTSNQFYSVPLEYFKNAVLSSPKYDIHRVVIFDKSGIQDPASYYESLLNGAKYDTNAHDKLIHVFGADADKYSSYDEFMKDKYSNWTPTSGSSGISGVSSNASGNAVTTTTTTTTDIREKKDASSFSEWIGNIAEKFTQFGSNIISAILSGDKSQLFVGSSSTSTSTSYSSSGSGGSASGASSSYNASQVKNVIIDAAYVKSLVNNAYASYNNNSDINMELAKNGYGLYQINTSNYDKITSNPAYSTITTLLASSTNYKKYVSQTFSAIYTWILVLQVAEIVKTKKSYSKDDKQLFSQYKAMINHTSGTASVDALNALTDKFGADAVKYETYEDYLMDITSDSKYLSSNNTYSTQINSKAASLYNKLSTMQLFAVGTPTDDYNIIPSWAKTSAGSGIPSAGSEVDTLHYLMDLMTKAETGGDINNPNDIDKMYFNPIWLNGESNVTIGRGGFYNANAKTVFTTAANSPSLSETTRGVMQSIASQIGSHSIKPADIKSLIEQYPDMKPALITAQDAMMNEFAWDYISRAANQYNSRGMKDPRSIILGAEFAGVAPATVPSFYSAVTSPGASNELDQVRQGMFNTIAGFSNYSKYGKGWKNRINGMYSMITSEGNGKNPWNGVYLPLPQHIIESIPSNMDLIPTSVGYGDAGYNMRDGMHMYTDDVYMGDSDNPMHVTLDQSPVTSRIDKLIELIDSAVNAKHEPVAGTSDAISSSIGTGPAKSNTQKSGYTKGSSSTAQSDRLAEIHNKIAKRTRVTTNYNHM